MAPLQKYVTILSKEKKSNQSYWVKDLPLSTMILS